MFGTWISDVQLALSARFPADGAYSAEDLQAPPMPPAVGHFLRYALNRRAARIEFSVETEWFDPNAPEVKAAFESYREALTSTARYPQSVWKSSLDRAVQFVVMHMVNPSYGIVTFVFGDSQDLVPKTRVAERLEYFGTHAGLTEAILDLLDEKKTAEIGPDDLRAIVLQADRSLVVGFQPADWVEYLAPLYEIADVVRESEKSDPALPTDLLKTFFEQKGCAEIVDRLEAVESVKGVHTVTAEVLRRAAGEKPEPAPEPEPAVQVKRVVRNDIHRDEEPAIVPRWMQFATASDDSAPSKTPKPPVSNPSPISVEDPALEKERDRPDVQGPESPVKIGQRAPVPDDLGIVTSGDGVEMSADEATDSVASVPRWTQFRDSSARPAAPGENARQDVSGVEERVMGRLNAVQRAWYINHLFASDRARWKSVMELLAGADDWDEASEIIATEVFERHGVDIYSRPAVDFTNAVEARFR